MHEVPHHHGKDTIQHLYAAENMEGIDNTYFHRRNLAVILS
jgi:hypothetical protein